MKEWTEKDVNIAVTNQLIGMLENDIINDYGIEEFVNWCENGDVFYNMYENEYGEDFCKECSVLANRISKHVDYLTYTFLASISTH